MEATRRTLAATLTRFMGASVSRITRSGCRTNTIRLRRSGRMDPDELVAALGRAIRTVRDDRRLSQEAIEREAGVHRNYVGGIERGERSPSVIAVARIARALDVSVADLFALAEGRLGEVPRRRDSTSGT
jgi:DNA-binding XRE family transcriptional regulator